MHVLSEVYSPNTAREEFVRVLAEKPKKGVDLQIPPTGLPRGSFRQKQASKAGEGTDISLSSVVKL